MPVHLGLDSLGLDSLGLDPGTSGVEAVFTGAAGEVLAQAGVPPGVRDPRPLRSEREPQARWRATGAALREAHRTLHPALQPVFAETANTGLLA